MNKLLIALSLIYSTVCSSQTMTISDISGAGTDQCSGAGVAGVSMVSRSLLSNNLYLAVVFSDSTSNYASLSGNGGETWVELTSFGSFTRRMKLWYCMPSSNLTSTITASHSFGSYPNSLVFHVYKIGNTSLGSNGANAVRQFKVDSATGADPTINFSSGVSANSLVLFFASGSNNAFTGTPESSYNELLDFGCQTYSGSSYTNGMYGEYRIGGSDSDPSFTASSSTWIGIAIEVKAGRRAIVTN